MSLFRRSELLAAAVLLSSAAPLPAQSTSDGALSGQALDARGTPVRKAQVTAANTATGEQRQTVTQPDGTFLLPHLTAGEYILRFAGRNGSQPIALAPIDVPLGQTVLLRAVLRGGAVSVQTISAPMPEQTPEPDQDADGLVSEHGLATSQNGQQLDGVSQTQSFHAVPVGAGADQAPDPEADSDSAEQTTGPQHGLGRSRHAGAAYTFSQASIRTSRLQTAGYTAGAGSAPGATLTAVTRSGSTKVHGSAFFTLRSQAFAATNPLSLATSYDRGVVSTQLVKPHDLRENYGATLGGPVPFTPDLHFFYTFDQQRRGFPAISSPGNPAFYTLTAVQQALLATRGVSAAQTASALTYLSSLTGQTARRQDQTIHFARLDWSARKHQQLGLQYNRVRWTSPAGLTEAPVVARGRASLGSASGSVDAVLAHWTWTLRPGILNQLRVQYLRDLQHESPQPSLPQESAIGPGGLAPETVIGPNGLLFGTPANLSQQALPDERRLQAAETITVTRGHQTFELGVDFSAVVDHAAALTNAAGTFRYDSTRTTATAGGLVDFLTDYTYNAQHIPNGACPSIRAAQHLFCYTSFTQSFGAQQVAFATQQWAGFAEDTWRPRPGLTLHAGLRYEYLLLPLPQAPNATLDALFGTRGATGIFPEDRNNLGPRLGLDAEPFGRGRGVVRLGYGAYFGHLPGATIRAALSDTALPGSTTHIRITPSVETACPQTPANPFGYVCSFLQTPSGTVGATTSATVFDRHFRLPVVQQASLGFERSFGRTLTVSATYVLNVDRQLAGSTDLNILPATQTAIYQLQTGSSELAPQRFVLPLYTSRVSPAFGPVPEIVSHGNGTYNGLSVTGELRPVRHLQVRMSYTRSKAIDYGQNQSATPRTMSQLDPFSNGYDKGLSATDYPQSLHATASWSPRVNAGAIHPARLVRALADGWTLAPVVTARSGRPYSYELFGGTRLPGGHLSLNGAGGALYLPTVGRNTLRLPAAIQTDLRVERSFQPATVKQAPLRVFASAEIFNLTNHVNLSSVEERAFQVGPAAGGVIPLVFQDAAAISAEGLTTQPFGSATGASSNQARERQMQLSVRLVF